MRINLYQKIQFTYSNHHQVINNTTLVFSQCNCNQTYMKMKTTHKFPQGRNPFDTFGSQGNKRESEANKSLLKIINALRIIL